MELVRDREIKKNELDHCYADVFRKRYQLEDWSGSLISNLRPVATPSSGGRRLSTTDGHFDGKGLSLKVTDKVLMIFYFIVCYYRLIILMKIDF